LGNFAQKFSLKQPIIEMKKPTVHTFFSGNVEINTRRRSELGEKGHLYEMSAQFAGGSANVAGALNQFGRDVRLTCFAGVTEDFGRVAFEFARNTVPFSSQVLYVLDKTTVALYDSDESCPGRGVTVGRGSILPEKSDYIQEQLEQIKISEGDILVGSIMKPESDFARILLTKAPGCRVLNPKESFCSSGLIDFLSGTTDMLIVNRSEWRACNCRFDDIHRKGVRVVVVTNDKDGGHFSVDGNASYEFAPFICPAMAYYTVGAGDWFIAGFLHELITCGESLHKADFDTVLRCTQFASKVAGRKVTMLGAQRGPRLDEIE